MRECMLLADERNKYNVFQSIKCSELPYSQKAYI